MSGTPIGMIASAAAKVAGPVLKGGETALSGAAKSPIDLLHSLGQLGGSAMGGTGGMPGAGGITPQSPMNIAPSAPVKLVPPMGPSPLNSYTPSSMADSPTGGVAVTPPSPMQTAPFGRLNNTLPDVGQITPPGPTNPMQQLLDAMKAKQAQPGQPAGAGGPSLAAQGAAGATAAMQANSQGLPYAPTPLQVGGANGGLDIGKLLQLAKMFGG